MSRAFIKESDDDGIGELPERPVSAHRNLVTAVGLAGIEAEVRRLEEELSSCRAGEDKPGVARCQRDLRYWSRRRASAELVPSPGRQDKVRFGSRVTLRGARGEVRTVSIVGEDEAAPAAGSISYVAPVAIRLLGAEVGDTVAIAGGDSEIIAIE